MRTFVHLNARSVDEAVEALVSYNGRARLNAGGTDLFGLLKDEFLPEYPEAIVNIKTITGLDQIWTDEGVLRIGALARLVDLANSPLLRERYGALAEAAHSVASPQLRNVATIGGNICQDVRCCYYRYPRHLGGPINCARKGNGPCLAVKGDNRQHAIMEGRRCFAVCPSDTAVALALYDAQLVVVGPAGERRIGIGEFYTPLGNVLNGNELVREIEIPALTGPCRQTFHKFTLRKPIDFAIVSVATAVSVSDGVCSDARIAVGAVAPGIHRAMAAEEFLLGRPLNEDSAAQAGELAVTGARPLSRNGYKVEIARTLVARALLGKRAGAGVMSEEVRTSQEEGRPGCDIHGHGGHGAG
ncbi:FAD binding domain-containing protein [Geobacter argillaceus]|uniref:Xanthine dehydrogenase YagS FAD-binding subunit n=1 Tax=Geobacter argillaceus TaxID=345631 RepID=A0A562VI55_9BACT|nr:FAD binding domain-containing protein [Geobacter argillaceus]TWJ17518.1 xanthine dehydrogenase YagS FAD-binding subunit [Geobacter argillaceus]